MSSLLKFERVENYIIVVPVFFIGLIFGWLYFSSESVHAGGECATLLASERIDTGTADYIKAAASANRSCAEAVVAKFGEQSLPFAMASGFASTILRGTKSKLGVEIMHDLIQEGGESYFFANDSELLAALNEIHPASGDSQKVKVETIFDFVLANSSEEIRKRAKPFDMARYVAFAPPANLTTEQVRPFCAREDCDVTTDVNQYCNLSDPAIKLFVKSNPSSARAMFNRCPVNASFVNISRRYGYLNSNCSSTLQVNASIEQNEIVDCNKLLQKIGQHSFSDQDIIIYIRTFSSSSNENHADNLRKFSEYFPGTKF